MSAISRSVYQKKCEENKRLLADIKVLTGPMSAERIQCAIKWREKFNKDDEFNRMIKEFLKSNKPQ